MGFRKLGIQHKVKENPQKNNEVEFQDDSHLAGKKAAQLNQSKKKENHNNR